MKEMKNYTIQPSMLMPTKVIYGGIAKDRKSGLIEWVTRQDVTEDVIKSFLFMMKSRCKEQVSEEGKGMKYNFKFDDYDFDISVKPISDASKQKNEVEE